MFEVGGVFEEPKSQTEKGLEKGLREVRETNRSGVQELTSQIKKCKLVMKEFMEYKKSSEKRIQKLEEAISNQADTTLQWFGEIGKRVDDLERKSESLERKAGGLKRKADDIEEESFNAGGSSEVWGREYSPLHIFPCTTDGH